MPSAFVEGNMSMSGASIDIVAGVATLYEALTGGRTLSVDVKDASPSVAELLFDKGVITSGK
jgi:hypothetical protein